MASKFEVEVEMKTPAEKVWSNLKDFAIVFPKALPHIYEKIDVLEGDGRTAGSIVMLTYKPESGFLTTLTERLETMDDEKKTLRSRAIDGEIFKYFKDLKLTICMSSKNDGALIKCCAEFEKANEELQFDDLFRDFMVKLLVDFDVYLLTI